MKVLRGLSHYPHSLTETIACSPSAIDPVTLASGGNFLLFCTTIKLILRRSFDGEESMKKVAEFKAADTGALVMTWTSWLQQTDPSTGNSKPILYSRRHNHLSCFTGWFDGWLAIGCAAGQITIIRITVSADSSVSVVQQHTCLPSQKSVTLLKWLKTGQLVVGRLGEVVVWSPGAELLFKLPFENYRGWPTIPSPIEVVHIPGQDRLVFSMADGTFRTIENLSTAPQVSLFAKGGSTMALTTTEEVRRGFMAVERAAAKNKATITPTTAMKLSGSPSLDEHGTVLLSYERHYLDVKTFLASTNHKQSVMLGRLAPLSAARAVEQIIPALQQEIRSLVEMHEMCAFDVFLICGPHPDHLRRRCGSIFQASIPTLPRYQAGVRSGWLTQSYPRLSWRRSTALAAYTPGARHERHAVGLSAEGQVVANSTFNKPTPFFLFCESLATTNSLDC